MVSLDSSFLIDLLAADPAAVEKARELDRRGETKFLTAPAASEVLVGAYHLGGSYLARTKTLVDSLTLLPFDRLSYDQAGRIGAELLRRGQQISKADLFIAAITVRHGERLIARDGAFSRVPGLALEIY